MRKIFDWILLAAILGGGGYVAYTHQAQLRGTLRNAQTRVWPCGSPVTYSIGTVDPRFGISSQVLIADLRDAEALWEKPIDKNLFQYDATGGDVIVDLVYDERQAATDMLRSEGIQIDKSQASYDALKAQYDTLSARVKSEQADYESTVAAYKEDEAAYNGQVQRSNARGGASASQYRQLQEEKAALEQKFAGVKALESAMNADINTLNALATAINQLIVQLNLNVRQYNQAGAAGGEFEEGSYSSGDGQRTIDIYEYSDHTQLVRVLAHEMGHALGLGHVPDPGSIMYKVNTGASLKLMPDDIAALNALCSSGI